MRASRPWPVTAVLAAAAITIACGRGGDDGGDGVGGTDAAAPEADGGGSGAVDAGQGPGADAATGGGADAAPAWACAPARAAGHQEIACPEGVAVEVEASAACVAGGCGVILDVHGMTMSADEEDAETRMRKLATPLGYVVVQPTAPATGGFTSWGEGEHDDVVHEALLATIDVFEIDPARVHMMGFSQGGMMTMRLVCKYGDLFASVAPAASGGCVTSGPPPAEVDILYMHGTKDYIVPWSTGQAQRDAILGWWDFGAPTTIAQGAKHEATRWVTSAGTTFEFWRHDFTGSVLYQGHCIPGPTSDGGDFRCEGAGQFDYAMEALRFFQEHPR